MGWRSNAMAWTVAAVLAVAASSPSLASAQSAGTTPDLRVPTKLALLVMLKVLTYDRNLASRGTGDFVVLVAYEAGQESGRAEVQTAIGELKGAALQTRPVRFEYVEFKDAASLKKAVDDRGAKALLLLPGLSAPGLATAGDVSTRAQIYSLALDPSFVEKSAALGVTNKDGRPQIVLNLAVARQVNAAFEPAVLKLARLIQ